MILACFADTGQHLVVIESAMLFSVWQINCGSNAVIQQDNELNQRLVIDILFTYELVRSTSYLPHPVSKHKDCNGENIHFKASKSDQWRCIWQQAGGLSGPQMVLLGIPTLTDIIHSQKYKKTVSAECLQQAWPFSSQGLHSWSNCNTDQELNNDTKKVHFACSHVTVTSMFWLCLCLTDKATGFFQESFLLCTSSHVSEPYS